VEALLKKALESREAFGVRCIPPLSIFLVELALRPEEFERRKKKEMKSAGIRTHSKRFAGSEAFLLVLILVLVLVPRPSILFWRTETEIKIEDEGRERG